MAGCGWLPEPDCETAVCIPSSKAKEMQYDIHMPISNPCIGRSVCYSCLCEPADSRLGLNQKAKTVEEIAGFKLTIRGVQHELNESQIHQIW